MKYKRILIAVDADKTSELAFKEAMTLAKELKAKLCILHVMEKLPDQIAYAVDVTKYQLLAQKEAEKILNKYRTLAVKNKIATETKLIEIINFKESIPKKIIKFIKSWKANLLVMGTHGRTGLPRFMLGSVAEEMLKTCPIPMLCVRKK